MVGLFEPSCELGGVCIVSSSVGSKSKSRGVPDTHTYTHTHTHTHTHTQQGRRLESRIIVHAPSDRAASSGNSSDPPSRMHKRNGHSLRPHP